MIRYLIPEQVLFIHARLIDETDGEHGLRDLSLLLSAMGRPQASLDNRELYADLFAKSAALLDTLIRNHPFLDGNKRTAITAVGLFLYHNRYTLIVDVDEMVRFTLACAQSRVGLGEIVEWLKKNSMMI